MSVIDGTHQDDPTAGGTPGGGAAPPAAAPPGGAAGAGGAAPARQDAATDAEALAFERGRNAALTEALQIAGTRPTQDAATSAQTVRIPDDPMDLLSPEQKQNLAALAESDPASYTRMMVDLGGRHQRMLIERDAAPLIASSASLVVEAFKGEKRAVEGARYAAIAPQFDRLLSGLDLRPLVNMSADARRAELGLRWDAARSSVIEAELTAARRPEPGLQGGGGGAGGSVPGAGEPSKFAADPWLVQMAAEYKFTPEQIREIEAAL